VLAVTWLETLIANGNPESLHRAHRIALDWAEHWRERGHEEMADVYLKEASDIQTAIDAVAGKERVA
jgi:hypothetical protein